MLLNKFLVEKIEYIYNALIITNWRKKEGIMVKYCPNCGVEVKEGFRFCLGCGAQLQADAAAQPAQISPPVTPPIQQQQPMPPTVAPQQGYAPISPQKSNMKLIGILIAVVVIVVVFLIVLLFARGLGGGSADDFVGTWSVSSMEIDTGAEWTFSNDGALAMTYDYGYGDPYSVTNTWRLENNMLYLGDTSGLDIDSGTGMKYEFSNGKNTISLKVTIGGQEFTAYTLTKT